MPAAQVVAGATRSASTGATRIARARARSAEPKRDSSGDAPGARRAEHTSAWAVFTGSVVFFSAVVAVYWNAAQVRFNDARYYVSLAEHPLHFSAAPFGFRVLTPYLVWLIHVKPIYGFAAVTVLSLAATAALLYVYLLEFYTARVAMFGVAMFAVSPAALIELKWAVNVDAFLFAMVMLAFLALVRKHWFLVGTALVLGVLDKETMLFVLLPLAVVGFSDYRFRPQRRWVALMGLPVLVYLVLHHTPLVFRPVPANYDYLSLKNLDFVVHEQQLLAGGGGGYSFFWSLVATFGALWILAALLVRKADRGIRQTAVFVVPVLASVLLADNWSRMLALAFVVIIPLVCAAGLNRPIAAGVLLFSYDAIVSLGVKNVSGHASYAIEIPLLLAAGAAAVAMARPTIAPRMIATASNASSPTVAVRRSAPQQAIATASNGARRAGESLRAAYSRTATATATATTTATAATPAAATAGATSTATAGATRSSTGSPSDVRRATESPDVTIVAPRSVRSPSQSTPPSTIPQRAVPQPAVPQPAVPEPAVPQPAVPQPAVPRPRAPLAVAAASNGASSAAEEPVVAPARTALAPPKVVRSEPFEHLEAAEALLADVQRLVAGAATRDPRRNEGGE